MTPVLVHGAAGGLGTAAVDLATALGARVIAVVSDPGKADSAEAAVHPVGGDRLDGSRRVLTREGRLLIVGFAGGSITPIDPTRPMGLDLEVLGVGWSAFWFQEPAAYLQQQWAELLPLLERGLLHPVLGHRYPLEDAAQALLELDRRRARHGAPRRPVARPPAGSWAEALGQD